MFTSLSPFRVLRRPLLLLVGLCGLSLTSCDDDDDHTPTTPATQSNIVQVAQGNPAFSTLVAAVVKADLTTTLSGAGPFTVLAPTNDAFAQLPQPFNNATNIAAIPAGDPNIARLRDILLYHVIAGRKAAADFPNGAGSQVTAKPASAAGVNDNTVYTSKSGSNITINGNSRVVTADVPASNGVIHAIDRVLLPPSGTIAAIVTAAANPPANSTTTPQFTVLLEALSQPSVAALLNAASSPSSNLTVFAPTDAAFTALLTQLNVTKAQLFANGPLLLSVLQLHVVNGRVFSSDLTSSTVPTLNTANPVTVAVNGATVTVRGPGNGTNVANVVTANVLANNGVVHAIDRVLLPTP